MVGIGSGTLKWLDDPYSPTTFSMIMAGHYSVPLYLYLPSISCIVQCTCLCGTSSMSLKFNILLHNTGNPPVIKISSPADSRNRRPPELSPCYWPLPLRLGETSPIFSEQTVRKRLLDMFPKYYLNPLKTMARANFPPFPPYFSPIKKSIR